MIEDRYILLGLVAMNAVSIVVIWLMAYVIRKQAKATSLCIRALEWGGKTVILRDDSIEVIDSDEMDERV